MDIKAVLFDCDGLMFNTEQISQDMWRKEAQKYNVILPQAFFVAITGAKRGTDFSAFYRTIPHLQEISDAMHEKKFDLAYWASYAPDGLNMKGLVPLLEYLEKKGIPCAVCSSSSEKYVRTLLGTISRPVKIDAVIGGDMVTKGKPDPEIFLKGAQVLHTAPENCLVLEDSKMGILAAKNAGMHSCFIRDTIVPDEDMKQAMDLEKKDLSEVISLLEESYG